MTMGDPSNLSYSLRVRLARCAEAARKRKGGREIRTPGFTALQRIGCPKLQTAYLEIKSTLLAIGGL